VLTGGTSNLSHIDDYAKRALGLAARVGKTTGFKSVVDDIEGPEYAAALGLMLFDSESHGTSGKKKDNKQKQKGSNPLAKFVSRFRV
jgi:cell division ATPase FtsA